MPAGVLRAVAPLEVPRLWAVNIGLTAALVADAFLFRADVSSVLQINQIVVDAVVVAMSPVCAMDAGKRLG